MIPRWGQNTARTIEIKLDLRGHSRQLGKFAKPRKLSVFAAMIFAHIMIMVTSHSCLSSQHEAVSPLVWSLFSSNRSDRWGIPGFSLVELDRGHHKRGQLALSFFCRNFGGSAGKCWEKWIGVFYEMGLLSKSTGKVLNIISIVVNIPMLSTKWVWKWW